MELQTLLSRVPFVYHLTSSENIPSIKSTRLLRSTSNLVDASSLNTNEKTELIHNRRENHVILDVEGVPISIRDQQPISIKSLNKCLENNMTSGQFIKLLNDRVFFWPSIKRLEVHFNRYSHEKPSIFRIPLADLIDHNQEILLCHLNSGATRCHPKWGGAPPPRGNDTFKTIEGYNEGLTRLAEVTILDSCNIPESTMISDSPHGNWGDF